MDRARPRHPHQPDADNFHLHRITDEDGLRRLEYRYNLRGRAYARVRLVDRHGVVVSVFDLPVDEGAHDPFTEST